MIKSYHLVHHLSTSFIKTRICLNWRKIESLESFQGDDFSIQVLLSVILSNKIGTVKQMDPRKNSVTAIKFANQNTFNIYRRGGVNITFHPSELG